MGTAYLHLIEVIMTNIVVLNDMVYIIHEGVEVGMPKSIILEIMKHPKMREGWDLNSPMQQMNCPKCGLVCTVSGTCGYCGSQCE